MFFKAFRDPPIESKHRIMLVNLLALLCKQQPSTIAYHGAGWHWAFLASLLLEYIFTGHKIE